MIIVMNKSDLLYYDAYEQFYEMTGKSEAFKAFCKDAFGEDFSQDGFSDVEQINRILPYVLAKTKGKPGDEKDVHILDIGCGNGKMLGYLQGKTGASIHGFDYSEKAIQTAEQIHTKEADFRVGVMGEIEYAPESFDVITSMDTMYFAADMTAFVGQIKFWLKPDGVFFVGYQEGDIMEKTRDAASTVLAQAFRANGLQYEVTDITRQTYEMLKRKREAARAHQKEFEAEGNTQWFEMLMYQTDCAMAGFEEFAEKLARYIYVVRK